MEIANQWADGEDALHNKRHRSPDVDRNRSFQNRRLFHRQYPEYDAPGQVSAGFQGNGGVHNRENHQNHGEQRGGYREDYRPRQNNGPRAPRPYMSPEEILNGPCQMHFYLDPNGERRSGHKQKECRTFQSLTRYASHTNAQAAHPQQQVIRSEVHLPPPPAITEQNQNVPRIAAAPQPPPILIQIGQYR